MNTLVALDATALTTALSEPGRKLVVYFDGCGRAVARIDEQGTSVVVSVLITDDGRDESSCEAFTEALSRLSTLAAAI